MNDRPRYWKPLRVIGPGEFHPLRPEVIAETMSAYSLSEEDARALLTREHAKCTYWINDLYQVQVAPCGQDGAMLHLCIRRRDGGMYKDWRHLQMIKNEIAGPEREAFELYPAESRKVDTSNKWHLWVMPVGVTMEGIGWSERDVQYAERRNVPGLRQRPL